MPAPHPSAKTVPIRWIVAAAAVFVVAYTLLRLFHGGHAGQLAPHRDHGGPAAVRRMVAPGYENIAVEIERPAEILPASRFAPAADEIAGAAGGLPPELDGALAPKPALPAAITGVSAPREIAPGGVYALQFTCAQPDYRTQVDGVQLLRRDRRIFLLPDFPRLGGALLARSKESVVIVRIPAGALAPGSYTVTVCGSRTSKTWQFTVR